MKHNILIILSMIVTMFAGGCASYDESQAMARESKYIAERALKEAAAARDIAGKAAAQAEKASEDAAIAAGAANAASEKAKRIFEEISLK